MESCLESPLPHSSSCCSDEVMKVCAMAKEKLQFTSAAQL